MEAILQSLLPTYTAGAVPDSLTALAAALLAQSRSKASALKPEEEAARSYTCCHIACERLKQRLNLPKIEARPPCGPRIYKNLYAYMDGALAAKPPQKRTELTSTPSTCTKGVRNMQTPTKTPLKTGHRSAATTPTTTRVASTHERKATDSLNLSKPNNTATEALPNWVTPALRQLCKKLDAPTAYPHVYTGILSITQSHRPEETLHTPSRRRTKAIKPDAEGAQHVQNWPGLLVAVLLVVLANVPNAASPSEAIDSAVRELVALKHVDAEEADEVAKSVEQLLETEGTKWQDMEWFRSAVMSNVSENREDVSDLDDNGNPETMSRLRSAQARPRATNGPNDGGLDLEDVGDPIESVQRSNGSLQIGLGTMMQDKIDWLSEERQLDYIRWKALMMKKIEQIVQAEDQEMTG